MITFYYHFTPNPLKVALFLEEAGLPYEVAPVDTLKGEQHSPAYLNINPNGKTPAIVDDGVRVFDSNAILLYLADKHRVFLGQPQERAELLSWLMFVATGLGPYSGQSVHFQSAAPEKIDYAIKRYRFETLRHYRILDDRLGRHPYIVGEDYTIVDMAAWGWASFSHRSLGEGEREKLPNLSRWYQGIAARPAAQRAVGLANAHELKRTMDEEARRALYPSMYAT